MIGNLSGERGRPLVVVCFIALFCLLAATVGDYAVTWDEKLSKTNGFLAFRWYDTLGADRAALSTMDLYLYGAFFDSISYVLGVVLAADPYQTAHVLIMLFGFAGLLGTYFLGASLGGRSVGLLATACLTLTPAYYGHLFNNPKDIPFAATFAWALYFLFRFHAEAPRARRGTILGLAVAIGLTLGIRVGGLLLFGYLGVFWAAKHLRDRRAPSWTESRAFLLDASLCFAIAWALMLVFWPYAQVKPLVNPLKALAGNAHFDFNPLVTFGGAAIRAQELPWTYLPTWITIRLPDFYLPALLGGAAVFLGRRRIVDTNCLLLFAVIFPPAVALLLGSTLYDGMRHFLFILPPLAVLTALAAKATWRALAPVVWARRFYAGSLLALAGIVAVDMVRLHPYQYVYFNYTVAGGLGRAARKYDLDYWAHTSAEATRWILENVGDETEVVQIGTCGNYEQVSHAIARAGKDDGFTALGKEPHLYVHLVNKDCFYKDPGEVVHRVRRMGVTLAEVRRVRDVPVKREAGS